MEIVTLHSLFKFISEKVKMNKSLIAIIPLVLGGFWQFLALVSIGPEYLRFYSISQQLADGFLIMFVLILFLFPILIFLKNCINRIFEIEAYKNNKDELRKETIRMTIGMVFFYSAFIYYFDYKFANGFLDVAKFDLLELFLGTCIILFVIYIAFCPIVGFYYLTKGFNFGNFKVLKTFFTFLLIFIFFVHIIPFVYGKFNSFHNRFNLPKKSINFEKLKKNISKDYPSKKISLIYSNDKFIFTKVDSMILVIKFDDLFDSNIKISSKTKN
jgi:hypothetical protein